MLAKKYRITKNKEFSEIMTKGKSVYAPVLIVKNINNDLDYSRFGIIVSNKVSKIAVKRNLIRRRIREIIRLNLNQIEKGKDIVIIVSPKTITDKKKVMAYEQIEKYLLTSFKKAKLI